MSAEACVSGMILELSATPPMADPFFFVVAAQTTINVSVNGTVVKIKVKGKNSVIWQDVADAALNFSTSYLTTAFPLPPPVPPSVLESFVLLPEQHSKKLANSGNGIMLNTFSGTFTATVTTPTQNSVPVTDPVLTKIGSWSITSSGQDPIKLRVSG